MKLWLLAAISVLMVFVCIYTPYVAAAPKIVKGNVTVSVGEVEVFFDPKPDQFKFSIPGEYRVVREPFHVKANFTKTGTYKATFILTYAKASGGRIIIRQNNVEVDSIEVKGKDVLAVITFRVGAGSGGVDVKQLSKLLDKKFTGFKNEVMAVNSVLVSVLGGVAALAFSLVMVINRMMVRADIKFSELMTLEPRRKTAGKIGIVGPEAQRKMRLLQKQLEALDRPGVNRQLLLRSIIKNLEEVVGSE